MKNIHYIDFNRLNIKLKERKHSMIEDDKYLWKALEKELKS